MFIYLVAIVVIICTIFGLTYSQTSFRDIGDGGERLSTIQLPAFSHSVPLIGHPRAGVDGDNGIVGGSSERPLEMTVQRSVNSIPIDGLNVEFDLIEEDGIGGGSPRLSTGMLDDQFLAALNAPWNDDEEHEQIFDEKLRDANQLGIAESLWQPTPLRGHDKVNQKYASDGAKSAPQKVNTNTIFNMIQYETIKEAMAVLQKQQEEEAAKLN